MTTDLALIAERRGGLAAVLGLLVLEEPGPGIAGLVAGVPALASLATSDPAIATEYERVFLRGVPLYESVFRSDDGQHGGETLGIVVESYERYGFTEYLEPRWRVAGVDHLGLQLRCLAHLCHQEATAWRAGTPDKAMEAVEAERSFLAQHLAAWAPVAVDGALRSMGEGAYTAVFEAIADQLTEEFDRLRPAPLLSSDIEIETLPDNMGPARLSRLLLAPATSGTWLSSTIIGRASRAIGAPWRPSDTRASLRHVLDDAENTGDLDVVLEPIAAALDDAITAHRRHTEESPGNAMHSEFWRRTAEQTLERLTHIANSGLYHRDHAMHSETFTISAPDSERLADVIDTMIGTLRRQGLCVQRHVKSECASVSQ